MKQHIKYFFYLFLLLNASLCSAQITTASLYGVIRGEDGASKQSNSNYMLFDAAVKVKNEVTGLEYEARTDDYGRFLLLSILPGGPYTVSVSYPGYGEKVIEEVFFNLRTKNHLDLKMSETFAETSTKELIKTLQGSEGITTATTNEIKLMPSAERYFQDFTRYSPYFNFNSYAGNNFRFNNVTLDGAINNDAIGFINAIGATPGTGQLGTAGSGSQTSAYSLDIIKQIDVLSNTYDVRLGNFAGASINMVTKTGTNKFQGTAYSYAKNNAITRLAKIQNFNDLISGASVSGALIPNKLFYFINGEVTNKNTPTFNNIGDNGGAIDAATALTIKDKMQTRYGINVGSTDIENLNTESKKIFARLDYSINKSNNLAFRAIYNVGSNDNLERSNRTFQFGGLKYKQHTEGLSLVAELNSYLTTNLTNNLIVGSTNVRDYRTPSSSITPFISISNDRIWAGTWREASLFNLSQKTFEITNNLSWHLGKHNITLGTHNEFYNIKYTFMNAWNGRWDYASVPDFLNDRPSRIRSTYNFDATKNDFTYNFNNPAAPYKWSQIGAYLQDDITLGKLTIAAGIRVENDYYASQPGITSLAENTKSNTNINGKTFTIANINQNEGKINAKLQISPRVSFKYDVKGDESVVLRGGSGIFTSRIPLSWNGYAFNLNGNHYGTIDWRTDAKYKIPLISNSAYLLDTLKTNPNISAAALNSNELNIIDKDLKLPTFWRSSLALDYKKNGWELGVEGLFSKTINDVLFQNLNQKDTSVFFAVGPNQSPNYVGGRLNNQFSSVMLLTNTSEGYRYNVSFRIGKEINQRILGTNKSWSAKANLSYTYGRALDMSNGIRNSFQSNFEANPSITPNTPVLSRSNFELPHNVIANGYFNLNWNKKQTTSFGIFYSGRSGVPYSMIYGGLNFLGNGSNANLVYMPKDRSEISLVPYTDNQGNVVSADAQWAGFEAFMAAQNLTNKRGQYLKRNELTSPWINTMDVRLSHEFRLKNNHSLQISIDIFNFLNLLNKKWGQVNYVSNTNNYTVPILYGAKDANGSLYRGKPGEANYTPNLNFVLRTDTDTVQNDELSSSWKGQIGARFTF
jgi:hypothetical protein